MKHESPYAFLKGVEKTAILFLCLGEERGSALMQNLMEYDIQRITHAMAGLGMISSEIVEQVLDEFMDGVRAGGSIVGSLEMAERMLSGFLPEAKVADIMNEIRGPLAGRTLWENVSSLNEQVIANYLQGEHDQTVAAILTKLKPGVAAKVLPLLGEERMADVAERMIVLESVPRPVLEQLEETLSKEFMASTVYRTQTDSHQRMADLFNKMDSTVFEALSDTLSARAPEVFAAIKQKMFTFDDLAGLDANSLTRLMRSVEGDMLALALRGSRKEVREHFLGALPNRSRTMLLEEMSLMGPVRNRDVQNAQVELVERAMDLARQDVIRLPLEDEEIVE